jgi:hypothetical protein
LQASTCLSLHVFPQVFRLLGTLSFITSGFIVTMHQKRTACFLTSQSSEGQQWYINNHDFLAKFQQYRTAAISR